MVECVFLLIFVDSETESVEMVGGEGYGTQSATVLLITRLKISTCTIMDCNK